MGTTKNVTFLEKVGISRQLSWGYLGILFFMVGACVEQGWLSPYLIERGITMRQSALLFSVQGIVIAISSWFSGVLSQGFGVKKTMFMGLMLYLVGTIIFVGYALPNLYLESMLFSYALRGFGYPLFAYTFLVWINYVCPQNFLGKAVGWFWFVFTLGMVVIGSYYSSYAIPRIGHINTLWSAIGWVLIGAFLTLILVKDKSVEGIKGDFKDKLNELLKGFTIVRQEPKVLLGGIVRVINTTAQFAFPIFLPTYMAMHGFSTTEWLQIWGTIFTSNIIFNLIFGFVGDSLGWRNTVMWFGGFGCGLTALLFYYSPQLFSQSYLGVLISGVLWGAMLAGYVPLSALVPSLVKDDKGAAMAILNLGAGLSVFVGPAIVGLFIEMIGSTGVVWILAMLYFISALLTKFITLQDNE